MNEDSCYSSCVTIYICTATFLYFTSMLPDIRIARSPAINTTCLTMHIELIGGDFVVISINLTTEGAKYMRFMTSMRFVGVQYSNLPLYNLERDYFWKVATVTMSQEKRFYI